MKTIIKTTLSILLGVFLTGSAAVAQDQSQSIKTVPGKNITKQILNENQKAMLKADQQKKLEMRKSFRATISQAQKDILSDPRLVKADRIKKFRASLTDSQVSIIKARQQEIKTEKDQFRVTLSDQQKIQLRKRAINRGRMNRNIGNGVRVQQPIGVI